MWEISIHALVKRATSQIKKSFQRRANFNPRPREEGDEAVEYYKWITFGISIHALVKRATMMLKITNIGKYISIHALVKRATGLGCGC